MVKSWSSVDERCRFYLPIEMLQIGRTRSYKKFFTERDFLVGCLLWVG